MNLIKLTIKSVNFRKSKKHFSLKVCVLGNLKALNFLSENYENNNFLNLKQQLTN